MALGLLFNLGRDAYRLHHHARLVPKETLVVGKREKEDSALFLDKLHVLMQR